MKDTTWFYWAETDARGPITFDELVTLVRSGQITAQSDVRKNSQVAWSQASVALPELFPDADGRVTRRSRLTWTDISPHPWRRYFARAVDNTLNGLFGWWMIGVAGALYAPEQTAAGLAFLKTPAGSLFDMLSTPLVALPITATMIGLTGLSLGKWIFGVRVLKNEKPIGIPAAVLREVRVWIFGLGCGVPIIALLALISAYRSLEDRRTTSWDRRLRATVYHRPFGVLATLLMWLAVICLFAFAIWLRIRSLH